MESGNNSSENGERKHTRADLLANQGVLTEVTNFKPGMEDDGIGMFDSDSKVSPWLRFGIEKDPWKDNKYHTLPVMHSSFSDIKDGMLTKAHILACSSNLEQMPDTKAFALTKLQINNKNISNINELISCHCFQYVDLSWNNVCELSALDNMVYLMCLDASHNRLKVAIDMKAPWYLTYINLSCNEIICINDLSEFWSLRHINLSYNNIEEICGLDKLKYVNYLNISHNKIACVKNIGNLDLKELNLEFNRISEWEENEVGALAISPEIKIINLNNNLLKSFKLFSGLHRLTELYVSNNRVTEAEEIDHLVEIKFLKKLALSGNRIPIDYNSIIVYYVPDIDYIDGKKISKVDKDSAKGMLNGNVLINTYYHHAKLLVFEQLSNNLHKEMNLTNQTSHQLVVLVGPEICGKLHLANLLAKEYEQYIYYARNHLSFLGMDEAEIEDDFIWVTPSTFNTMTINGQFLATTEFIGFSCGLSKDEFSKSVEQGKMCLAVGDIMMAFCLQALGLKPFLILVMLNDVNTHVKHILETLVNKKESSFSKIKKHIARTSMNYKFSKQSTIDDYLEKRSTETLEVGSSNDEEEGLNSLDDDDDDDDNASMLDPFLYDIPSYSQQSYSSEPSLPATQRQNMEQFRYYSWNKTSFNECGGLLSDDSLDSLTDTITLHRIAKRRNRVWHNRFTSQSSIPYLSLTDSRTFSDHEVTVSFTGSVQDTEKLLSGSPKSSIGDKYQDSKSFLTETSNEVNNVLSLSETCINYISKKILENRQIYTDLHKSGYFAKTILTDSMDSAYNELKKVIKNVYNICLPEVCFQNYPFYEDVVKKRVGDLMHELDKTESTDIFYRKSKKDNIREAGNQKR